MTMLVIEGAPFPATVTPMSHEALTFVTLEYGGRTFRFSIRGAELPYEVAFLYDFDDTQGRSGSAPVLGAAHAEPHEAWFTIAPERAANPEVLQEFLYPQLIEVHEAAMAAKA